jgi:hypothetical protein
MYDKFFLVCTFLTNYHLKKNLLRSDDRGYYKAVILKRLGKAQEKIRKNEKKGIIKRSWQERCNVTLSWMFVKSSEE